MSNHKDEVSKMFPDSLKEFRNYVRASYAECEEQEIEKAILELAAKVFLDSPVHWGSPESGDLERVREILVDNRVKGVPSYGS